jgi:hypothetical protein
MFDIKGALRHGEAPFLFEMAGYRLTLPAKDRHNIINQGVPGDTDRIARARFLIIKCAV